MSPVPNPQLEITSDSNSTHTLYVQLKKLEKTPEETTPPTESSEITFEKTLSFEPYDELRLDEYREPGTHYYLSVEVDGKSFVDEILSPQESLKIIVHSATDVEIERTVT